MDTETTTQNNTSPSDYNEIIKLVGANFGYKVRLPGDLVEQILFKLPVESFLRFKAVCKSWNRLITSPEFINIHLQRKNPHADGLSGTISIYNEKNGYFKDPPFQLIRVVGNCNGVILATSNQNYGLILYNHSLKEYSGLPVEFREKFYQRRNSYSDQFFGFCYLPQTQEYKVVSFEVSTERSYVDMKVLTLGMHYKSLRDVKDIVLPGRIGYRRFGANSGTSLFWLGYELDPSDIVICYDVVEDRFSKMDVPCYSSTSKLDRHLGVLKGSVNMFVFPYDDTTWFDIWILVIDDVSMNKGWMKYRTVGPFLKPSWKSLNMHPIIESWYDRFILCHDGDRGGVEDKYYERSKFLFYYDVEADEIVDYKVTYPPIRQYVVYVKNLVSVKRLCS